MFMHATLAFRMKESRLEANNHFDDRLDNDWKIVMEMAETVWEEDEDREQEVEELNKDGLEDVMEASEDI